MDIHATGQLQHSDYKKFVLKIKHQVDELSSFKSPRNMDDLVGRPHLYPEVPGVTSNAA
jgi:hypothetical protein